MGLQRKQIHESTESKTKVPVSRQRTRRSPPCQQFFPKIERYPNKEVCSIHAHRTLINCVFLCVDLIQASVVTSSLAEICTGYPHPRVCASTSIPSDLQHLPRAVVYGTVPSVFLPHNNNKSCKRPKPGWTWLESYYRRQLANRVTMINVTSIKVKGWWGSKR